MITVYAILVFLSAVVTWIYTQTFNGVFRAKAKDKPHSIAAMMLRFIDPILDSTLFKEIKPNREANTIRLGADKRAMREMNSLYDSNELVIINNSISVSIDFTRNISERSLRYIGNPLIHIFIIFVLSYLLSIFITLIMSTLLFNINVFDSAFLISVLVFFLILYIFGGEGGFIVTLISLRIWPNVLIVIDHRLILMESAWIGNMGHIVFNDGTSEFAVIDAGQSVGIGWKNINSKTHGVIFLVPKSFLDLFFENNKLEVLCVKLNDLLWQAKNTDKSD